MICLLFSLTNSSNLRMSCWIEIIEGVIVWIYIIADLSLAGNAVYAPRVMYVYEILS